MSNIMIIAVAVYYASGTSIAKFPEGGIVVTKTLKDQGGFNISY